MREVETLKATLAPRSPIKPSSSPFKDAPSILSEVELAQDAHPLFRKSPEKGNISFSSFLCENEYCRRDLGAAC